MNRQPMPTLLKVFLTAFCLCFGVVVLASGLHIPAIQTQSGPELLIDCIVAAAIGTGLYGPLSALLGMVPAQFAQADEVEFDMVPDEEAEAIQ
jgi:hypothetical protein